MNLLELESIKDKSQIKELALLFLEIKDWVEELDSLGRSGYGTSYKTELESVLCDLHTIYFELIDKYNFNGIEIGCVKWYAKDIAKW